MVQALAEAKAAEKDAEKQKEEAQKEFEDMEAELSKANQVSEEAYEAVAKLEEEELELQKLVMKLEEEKNAADIIKERKRAEADKAQDAFNRAAAKQAVKTRMRDLLEIVRNKTKDFFLSTDAVVDKSRAWIKEQREAKVKGDLDAKEFIRTDEASKEIVKTMIANFNMMTVSFNQVLAEEKGLAEGTDYENFLLISSAKPEIMKDFKYTMKLACDPRGRTGDDKNTCGQDLPSVVGAERIERFKKCPDDCPLKDGFKLGVSAVMQMIRTQVWKTGPDSEMEEGEGTAAEAPAAAA